MAAVVDESIRALQDEGFKATRSRKQVIQVLEAADRPLTAYEIQRSLEQQGKHLNQVTVYRTLDLLCRLNLAHKLLSSGGFIKCSLCRSESCHRFAVCQCCGAVQEFADTGLCQHELEFARELGFHTRHHVSESTGLCARCHGRGEAAGPERRSD